MGDLFERLTQLYLQTHPTYRSKIKNVWWCNNGELPEEVRKKLNLPETDEGIDLLCETYSGEYWSVQSKYQTNSDRPLNYKKLSTFLSLSFVTAKGISTGLVVHTSTKKVKKSHLMGNTVELGLQHWLDITDGQWDQILDVCRGNLLQPPEKRNPRKYQKLAIQKAKLHFLKQGHSRGKLIMPCGAGKSLIAYWSTKALKAKSVIVAVPSLALVKQSLEDWTSEFLAEGIHPEWMAVCSDDSVGRMKEADSTVATVYEAGIPTTTDPTEIVNFIKKKSKNPKVIFTTYQSSPKLADACKKQGLTIDLLIADEAHKTVGRKDKKFATLLSDENIKIKQRMFMTATERVYRQGTEDIASMDDESVYGKIFHQMSFKKAIDDGIICDYRILTIAVSEAEVANLIREHTEVNALLGNQKVETDAHTLAAGIAIEKSFQKIGIKHAISFHRSIKRGVDFSVQQNTFSGKLGNKLKIEYRNISSKHSAGQRSQILKQFVHDDRSLITNARCLTEGVDIPAIDCVAFIDPKKSVVDIVQAAGRAMRLSNDTGKTYGYILLPIVVPDGHDLIEFADTTDFRALARILTVLSTQDERIAEQLRERQPGEPPRPEDIIVIDPDIIDAFDVEYQEIFDGISSTFWKKVGRANYRKFEDARTFVRTLKLKSGSEWDKFVRSGKLPPDIPTDLRQYYLNRGWISMGDFLGTGYVAHKNRKYLPYIKAQKIVASYGLKNQQEWKDFTKSKEFPTGVHKSPDRYYEEFVSLGAWLGTGTVASGNRVYRSFDDARAFVRKLKLKNMQQWREYAKSGALPPDIPADPRQYYLTLGWVSSGDFLGTDFVASQKRKDGYLPWPDARKFARKQKLKSSTEWRTFSLNIPPEIHKKPDEFYEEWAGWPDFLGYRPHKLPKGEAYLDFVSARKFLREKGFKNRDEFKEWCKTAERPLNIPTNINRHYDKHEKWKGIKDFLGY